MHWRSYLDYPVSIARGGRASKSAKYGYVCGICSPKSFTMNWSLSACCMCNSRKMVSLACCFYRGMPIQFGQFNSVIEPYQQQLRRLTYIRSLVLGGCTSLGCVGIFSIQWRKRKKCSGSNLSRSVKTIWKKGTILDREPCVLCTCARGMFSPRSFNPYTMYPSCDFRPRHSLNNCLRHGSR